MFKIFQTIFKELSDNVKFRKISCRQFGINALLSHNISRKAWLNILFLISYITFFAIVCYLLATGFLTLVFIFEFTDLRCIFSLILEIANLSHVIAYKQ